MEHSYHYLTPQPARYFSHECPRVVLAATLGPATPAEPVPPRIRGPPSPLSTPARLSTPPRLSTARSARWRASYQRQRRYEGGNGSALRGSPRPTPRGRTRSGVLRIAAAPRHHRPPTLPHHNSTSFFRDLMAEAGALGTGSPGAGGSGVATGRTSRISYRAASVFAATFLRRLTTTGRSPTE